MCEIFINGEKRKLLVGADPELFVKNEKGFVSGHGMVPGDKANPHKVEKGAVQVDGMALEFNIDPASSAEEFSRNISSVMDTLSGMIPKGLSLSNSPVAEFSKEIMDAQPKEALELGCEPDYNAYTGQVNPRPNGEVDYRTGAGHIHIGWTEGVDPTDPDHFMACRLLAAELDIQLYTLSTLWDKDEKRRKMYGAPGAFRPKPYGMEYRVLSNAWVGDEEITKLIYEIVTETFVKLLEGIRNFRFENNNICGVLKDHSPHNLVMGGLRLWGFPRLLQILKERKGE